MRPYKKYNDIQIDYLEVETLSTNKNNFMNKWYNSSSNPSELSLTIKALLLGWIPIVITVSQIFNFPLSESLLIEIVNWISLVLAGLMFLYGVGRKAYYRFK